jgi:hypothetical protein
MTQFKTDNLRRPSMDNKWEDRPKKLNPRVELILTILAVALAVLVIGGSVWHYETISSGPCYSAYGTSYNGNC